MAYANKWYSNMQYLHILEGEKKLSGRFSQFGNFVDTAVLAFTVEQRTCILYVGFTSLVIF